MWYILYYLHSVQHVKDIALDFLFLAPSLVSLLIVIFARSEKRVDGDHPDCSVRACTNPLVGIPQPRPYISVISRLGPEQ